MSSYTVLAVICFLSRLGSTQDLTSRFSIAICDYYNESLSMNALNLDIGIGNALTLERPKCGQQVLEALEKCPPNVPCSEILLSLVPSMSLGTQSEGVYATEVRKRNGNFCSAVNNRQSTDGTGKCKFFHLYITVQEGIDLITSSLELPHGAPNPEQLPII
jgi:hypothetical protein